LGLDVKRSAMAVVIQEMIDGDRSGIVFGKSPTDESETIIEAVYGLNQGLVDGNIEPDRWVLSRKTGQEISHHSPLREKAMRPTREGIRIETLPAALRRKPPLKIGELQQIYELAIKAEVLFGSPQDLEWTFLNERLYTLQARHITSYTETQDDERPWYLSLHRSFENLLDLRIKIEKDLLPSMKKEAMEWSKMDLSNQSNEALSNEIERRIARYDDWLEQYREYCIPFAHGMRLFGQIYNDIMQPEDPFEFIEILSQTGMKSLARNQMLQELSQQIRDNPDIKSFLRQDRLKDCPPRFRKRFEDLLMEFGDLAWGDSPFIRDSRQLARFLMELSNKAEGIKPAASKMGHKDLEKEFLSHFSAENKGYAREMIELGRASYRLRDDDNIYLGKIEGQMLFALDEGRKRMREKYSSDIDTLEKEDVIKYLRGSFFVPKKHAIRKAFKTEPFQIKARQIMGQAGGPGVAVGKARVILGPEDLFAFEEGEILVCDSIDPGMTFVVPLAAGIIERRGGMLIHGAIIAREYGLLCVTGAPGAAEWIKTGDTVTVDGFLGIVIISARQ
jgi:phosphohistidine swiveling domain-containing protein